MLAGYSGIVAALLILGGLAGVVTVWLFVQIQLVGVRMHLQTQRRLDPDNPDTPWPRFRPGPGFGAAMAVCVLGTLFGGGLLLAERWLAGALLLTAGAVGTAVAWARVPEGFA